MKSVLVTLTQNDQNHLNVNESISALMLFASFDISISVLFKDAALSLLMPRDGVDLDLKQFLKPAHKMVESFEFYDIENLYVLNEQTHHPALINSPHSFKSIEFNAEFLQQFDHIITW